MSPMHSVIERARSTSFPITRPSSEGAAFHCPSRKATALGRSRALQSKRMDQNERRPRMGPPGWGPVPDLLRRGGGGAPENKVKQFRSENGTTDHTRAAAPPQPS